MNKAKGYCLNANNLSDAERVFEVSLQRKKNFCPICLNNHDTQESVKVYEKILAGKIHTASRKFLHEFDFTSAYKAFASVIELDDEYVPAYLWRIVSLMCLSTIRRSLFVEANDLIVSELELFSNYDDSDLLSKFVTRVINITSLYLREFKSNCCYKNYFYETEGISHYYQRTNEIFILLENIRIICEKNHKISKSKQERMLKLLTNRVDELKEALNYNYATIDGNIYKLARFMAGGQAIISKEKKVNPVRIAQGRIRTLETKEKHKIVIPDDVFGVFNKFYRFRIFDIWLSSIFFTTAVAFAVLTFLYFSSQALFIIFLSIGIVSLILSLISFTHIFYCSIQIKKIKKWLF